MEKAIIKTLIYADIFNYPLKAWEIHKWLIGRKTDLPGVEKALTSKSLRSRVKSQDGYYYLKGRKKIVEQRLGKEKQSAKLMRQAIFISKFFKLVPGVKLVGVSGNLAMDNADRFDDIDLFVITSKGKLWSSRATLVGILTFLDRRRSRNEKKELAAGKVCLNLLLEENNLRQKNTDLYTAHEVLQMRVLWQRGNIYSKFLEDNEWVFKFLPNWVSTVNTGGNSVGAPGPASSVSRRPSSLSPSSRALEAVVKTLQLRYMGRPSGKERIGEGELYFHPEDYREKILTEFKRRAVRMLKNG